MSKEVSHRGGELSGLMLLWVCLSCGTEINKVVPPSPSNIPAHSEEKQELLEEDESYISRKSLPAVTLKEYENSSFSTITHFELQTDPAQVMHIEWEVQGGRYHVLEDELSSLSQAYPFQKSILFKEKKKYQVSAEISLITGEKIKKVSEIDLSDLSQHIFSDSVLMVDSTYVSVNEPVKIWHDEEAFHNSEHVWKLKKLSFRECPKDIYDVELEKNPRAKIIFQKICDTVYGETIERGTDYVQLNEKNSTDFVFRSPGKYEVSMIKIGRNGEVMHMATRQLTVGNTLVSRRGE